MILAVIASIVFLAHVAVWLGIPDERVNESAPADVMLSPYS